MCQEDRAEQLPSSSKLTMHSVGLAFNIKFEGLMIQRKEFGVWPLKFHRTIGIESWKREYAYIST